jgi:hypothetical protein
VLRDMIQSHLLPLALVAMEPLVTMSGPNTCATKSEGAEGDSPDHAERGACPRLPRQYASGSIDGKPVPGYLEEPGVAADSTTETYAALLLFIDNWRWAGCRSTCAPASAWRKAARRSALRSKPAAGFAAPHAPRPAAAELDHARHPAQRLPENGMQVQGARLGLAYPRDQLDATYRKGDDEDYDAYGRAIAGCDSGRSFAVPAHRRSEAAWRVVDPILKVWAMERDFINGYPAGSCGPRGTYRLFDRDDQFWRHSLNLDGAICRLIKIMNRFLAGDIGGTKTRLATVEVTGTQVRIEREADYPSRLRQICRLARRLSGRCLMFPSRGFRRRRPGAGQAVQTTTYSRQVSMPMPATAVRFGALHPAQRSGSDCLWLAGIGRG